MMEWKEERLADPTPCPGCGRRGIGEDAGLHDLMAGAERLLDLYGFLTESLCQRRLRVRHDTAGLIMARMRERPGGVKEVAPHWHPSPQWNERYANSGGRKQKPDNGQKPGSVPVLHDAQAKRLYDEAGRMLAEEGGRSGRPDLGKSLSGEQPDDDGPASAGGRFDWVRKQQADERANV